MVHKVWKINLYEESEAGDQIYGICKVCRQAGKKKDKFKISDGSVKSLITYLKQHPEYQAKFEKMDDTSQEAAGMQKFVVHASGGMSSLDKKVINYVAENCVSFNSVESRSFISLFNPTNSNEKLKARQHYSRNVLPRAYNAVVNLIKAKLKKFEAPSFTTDIWSSTSYCFISLTAHGINQEWKRDKYVLAIRELQGSHTADVINAAIREILDEWEIKQEMCHVIVRDGAANMKKAFEGRFEHADCGAHKLNLAVKGTIKDAQPLIKTVLEKCRKLLQQSSLSNLAKDRLKECQADAQLKQNHVIQDVATRWNSTLAMVERLFQQKKAIELYFARHKPPTEARCLSLSEWKLMKGLALLLEPAEASSLDICKDDSHLGLQMASSQMLMKELADVEVPDIKPEMEMLRAKIEDRFGGLEHKSNYGLALFLDPGFKDRRVADSAEFRLQDENWIAGEYQPFSAQVEQVAEAVESSQESETAKKKPRSLFAREKLTEEETLPKPNSWTENFSFEIVLYNAEKTSTLSSDPLLYWQVNVVRFPILSKAARRFLSAPPTSVASEQLFSHARDVFDYRRGQLDAKNAEQLIFLNKVLEYVNFTY